MIRWKAIVIVGAAMVGGAGPAACDDDPPVPKMCSNTEPAATVDDAGAVVSIATTTTVSTMGMTTTTTTSDGGATATVSAVVDAGSIQTSTAVTNPATVFVNLQVQATFGCPLVGAARATLVASAGQFTNGIAAAASASSSGVSGSSVTILLGDDGSDASTQKGYTTLQLTTEREAQVQVQFGDQLSCTIVRISALDASARTATATQEPCRP